MLLAVRRQQCVHMAKPAFLRKKVDKEAIESVSMRAAFALSLQREFQATTPVPPERIQEEFINAWMLGSDQIDMEMGAALIEMAEDSSA